MITRIRNQLVIAGAAGVALLLLAGLFKTCILVLTNAPLF